MAKPKAQNQAPISKKSKVFDVAKPGETPADTTSRPVIVGHTPMIKQDPMVVGDEAEETEKASSRSKDLKIEPLETTDDLTQEKTSEDSKIEKETTEDTTKEPTETNEPAEVEQEGSSDADSDSAAVDMLADEAGKKQSIKEAEKEAQRNQEIEKIIASRTYNVHTKTPPGKRTARSVVVLLLLIAIGAGVFYFLYGPGKDTIQF
jgi:hypothetical protein